MATIASRLTSTGTLFVNGIIDEVTQTTISTNTNTVFSSLFDEISNSNSTITRRDGANGVVQLSGIFDEFTGAPVVDNSLSLWIDAEQIESYPGSGSNWFDLTTNNNITLANNPTFTSTKIGGSITFVDSATQYGVGSGTPLGITAYTKAVWFYLTSIADNNLLSSYAGGHFMYFANSSKMYCGHSDWGNYQAFPSVTTFNTGVWYHACLTFDTINGMSLYINGFLDSVYTAQKTSLPGTGQCNLGCYNPGSNLLNGSISQAMIYNRALTADEVSQNFNALRRRYNI